MKNKKLVDKSIATYLKESNGIWTGYLWYSNATGPKVVNKETGAIVAEKLTDLPFVLEGELWNTNTHISLKIRWFNGSYQYATQHISDSKLHIPITIAIVPGMKKKALLVQHAEWVDDPLLKDVKVCRPGQFWFMGFK